MNKSRTVALTADSKQEKPRQFVWTADAVFVPAFHVNPEILENATWLKEMETASAYYARKVEALSDTFQQENIDLQCRLRLQAVHGHE
jgi:hypothetical protein